MRCKNTCRYTSYRRRAAEHHRTGRFQVAYFTLPDLLTTAALHGACVDDYAGPWSREARQRGGFAKRRMEPGSLDITRQLNRPLAFKGTASIGFSWNLSWRYFHADERQRAVDVAGDNNTVPTATLSLSILGPSFKSHTLQGSEKKLLVRAKRKRRALTRRSVATGG